MFTRNSVITNPYLFVWSVYVLSSRGSKTFTLLRILEGPGSCINYPQVIYNLFTCYRIREIRLWSITSFCTSWTSENRKLFLREKFCPKNYVRPTVFTVRSVTIDQVREIGYGQTFINHLCVITFITPLKRVDQFSEVKGEQWCFLALEPLLQHFKGQNVHTSLFTGLKSKKG